ncbi:carbamoyltransferase C-terminal domain-containing protein [Bradyrhizobium sp. 131]|uniref:carbamoyltransferase C-terminal domain-containing protein n=1 Tax=Bradyrhizobium sp. 131 TaxID=2782609 RepID=UPI0020003E1F|nr:carbamoyltransferase C-terminal domain-containing protein [Bradyrhizobium sp. 131]
MQGIEKLNAPAKRYTGGHTYRLFRSRADGACRNQPALLRLLREFEARTGSSVLVNTSVNVRDEPIVCNPEDAYRCFMNCEMDVLVIGNIVLLKEDQLPPLPSTARAEIRLFPPAKPWYISTGAYSLLEMSRIATDLQLDSVRPGVKGNDDQPV